MRRETVSKFSTFFFRNETTSGHCLCPTERSRDINSERAHKWPGSSEIHQIRDIIKQIAAQGTTILLASHLLDEVEKVCSHVLVLRKGVILYSGTVDGMSANEGFFELQADDTKR
jgi:hypothetical protein